MNTVPTTPLPDWQRERLTLLLDVLNGVPITDAERGQFDVAVWLGAAHCAEHRRSDHPGPAERASPDRYQGTGQHPITGLHQAEQCDHPRVDP